MSDKSPRFVSTGQSIPEQPAEVTPAQLREARQKTPRQEQIRELEARREAHAQKEAVTAHDVAVRNFDAQFGDVTRNPFLLQQAVAHRQQRINEAVQKAGAITDWNEFYRELGEDVRKNAGLPTSAERDRQDALDEARRSRGK